jgi:hypothetical protein
MDVGMGNLKTGGGENNGFDFKCFDLGGGDFLGNLPEGTEFFDLVNPAVMLFGNYQGVADNHGRDVKKSHKMFILIDKIGGNFFGSDLAKKT